MNLKQKSGQYQIILSVAIVVLIALVLILLAIVPLISNLKQTHAKITKNQIELYRIKSDIKGFEQLSQQITQVEAHEQDVARLFPVREEMASLVQGLENSVAKANTTHKLSITDAKESNAQSNSQAKGKTEAAVVPGLKQIEEIPYTLAISGEYRRVVDFLLAIEHQPFFTEFQKFTITADQTQRGSGQEFELFNLGTASAKLEGVFFIQKL